MPRRSTWASSLGGEEFDAVVLADVLEHLQDPGALLRKVRDLLTPGAVVVASIPNVAHGSLRLALLGGEFRYRDLGLLDETHLRFFTRASIQDLFEEAGYVVTRWLRQRVDIDAGEISPPPGVPDEVRAWLSADPEATTYQFVIRAVASDETSRLLALRRELDEAQELVRRAEAEVERLNADELAQLGRMRDEHEERLLELAATKRELETLRRAHEALGRRLAAERVAMTDSFSALERNLEILHRSRSFRYTAPFRALFGRHRR